MKRILIWLPLVLPFGVMLWWALAPTTVPTTLCAATVCLWPGGFLVTALALLLDAGTAAPVSR
jgi:hypothetical protein